MGKTNKNKRKGGTITQRIRSLFSRGKPKPRPPTPPPNEPRDPSPRPPTPPPPHVPTPPPPMPSSPASEKIELQDVNKIIEKLLHEEDEIKISKNVRNYFVKLLNTNSVDEIRRIDKIEDDALMGFEFADSVSDKKVLLTILEELISLSINRTRDSRRKLVSEKIIGDVLKSQPNAHIKRLLE